MTVLYDPSTIVAPPTPTPNTPIDSPVWTHYLMFWRIQAELRTAAAQQSAADAFVALKPKVVPDPAPVPTDPPAPPVPGPTPVPSDTLQGRTVEVAREWVALVQSQQIGLI